MQRPGDLHFITPCNIRRETFVKKLQTTPDHPQIIYLDDQFVAVNKPPGLLVHRSDIDRHETRFALQLVRNRLGRHVFPVHRLDRPTSGVLLFALSGEAARQAAEAMESAQAAKIYLAVVRGVVEDEGRIDYPLPDLQDRLEMRTGRSGEVRHAVTDFRRLAAAELPFTVGPHPTARYSLLEVKPRTGRRHQIRRHLKHIFHPVIGDTTYGDGRHNRLFRDELGCSRLLLHAVKLSFIHPCSREPMTITAPLDDAFGSVIDRLGWSSEMLACGLSAESPPCPAGLP
jgi:tRNA pseudouridine65 synthase